MLIIFLYLRPNNVSHKMPTLTYHGYAVLMLWQIAFGGVFCSVDRVSHHVKTMCADFVLVQLNINVTNADAKLRSQEDE